MYVRVFMMIDAMLIARYMLVCVCVCVCVYVCVCVCVTILNEHLMRLRRKTQ